MEPAGAVRARDPLVLVGWIFNCGSRKTLCSMEAYRIAVVLVRKAERYHCIYVTMNLRLLDCSMYLMLCSGRRNRARPPHHKVHQSNCDPHQCTHLEARHFKTCS
jgi:hypothetical protein